MFDKLWHGRLRRPFNLYFQRFGQGPQAVVLLHGITSDGSFWRPLIDLLPAAKCTVVVPDLLGHGQSPRPSFIKYTTDDQARAVAKLLRKQGIKQYILVGHSMGCLVASRFAHMTPGKISNLLLYEPPLYGDVPEFKTHARRRKFYFGIYERIAANPPGRLTTARVVARISRNWTKFLDSEQAWLPIERSLRNTIIAQTCFDELKDIAIQTDIVHGRLDMAVSRADLKRMLAHNTHIRFYQTTQNHGLSARSARYLAQLIAPDLIISQNKKSKQKGTHASTAK